MEQRDAFNRVILPTGVEPPGPNDVLGFESVLITERGIFSLGAHRRCGDFGIIYWNSTVFGFEAKPGALRHDFVALVAVTSSVAYSRVV